MPDEIVWDRLLTNLDTRFRGDRGRPATPDKSED
jgi:hypothetical protein